MKVRKPNRGPIKAPCRVPGSTLKPAATRSETGCAAVSCRPDRLPYLRKPSEDAGPSNLDPIPGLDHAPAQPAPVPAEPKPEGPRRDPSIPVKIGADSPARRAASTRFTGNRRFFKGWKGRHETPNSRHR